MSGGLLNHLNAVRGAVSAFGTDWVKDGSTARNELTDCIGKQFSVASWTAVEKAIHPITLLYAINFP